MIKEKAFLMPELSEILASVIGSSIVGVVLLGSAPLWWKRWVTFRETAEIWKKIKGLAAGAFLLLIIVGLSLLLDYFERSSIPRYHNLTAKEPAVAFSECETESITVTSSILSRSERNASRRRIRAACLIGKGFTWEPRIESEGQP